MREQHPQERRGRFMGPDSKNIGVGGDCSKPAAFLRGKSKNPWRKLHWEDLPSARAGGMSGGKASCHKPFPNPAVRGGRCPKPGGEQGEDSGWIQGGNEQEKLGMFPPLTPSSAGGAWGLPSPSSRLFIPAPAPGYRRRRRRRRALRAPQLSRLHLGTPGAEEPFSPAGGAPEQQRAPQEPFPFHLLSISAAERRRG